MKNLQCVSNEHLEALKGLLCINYDMVALRDLSVRIAEGSFMFFLTDEAKIALLKAVGLVACASLSQEAVVGLCIKFDAIIASLSEKNDENS